MDTVAEFPMHGSSPALDVTIAQAAFPNSTRFMQMQDQLGPLYDDATFADLYPRRGQPTEAPWRLALITVMQYADNLTDRQAADAVRSRIDWKYALGLELTDPGFDHSVLSKFRTRLIEGTAEQPLPGPGIGGLPKAAASGRAHGEAAAIPFCTAATQA